MKNAFLPRAALLLGALLPLAAAAQIAVSVNDNKMVLDNGVPKVAANPQPDTVAIIDMKTMPPRLIDEIKAPASVAGPPLSVAVAPDESIALVTSAMKVSPTDPTKVVPDNRMSVIDLTQRPARILATLPTGNSPAGVSINRAGTLALVANRADCTVSVFAIAGKTVTPAGTVSLGGAPDCGASHVAISPDGRSALVTRDNDHKISALAIDGMKVEYTKRDMNPGLRPYGIDICVPGSIAVVANIGVGQGDADTISVVDMTAKPPRIIETLTVGQTPEGIKCSPDGSYVAVVVMNGSNKPKESPFYGPNGKLVLYMVTGKTLQKFGELPIGNWSQGVAFAPDGLTVLVQNMVQKDIQVFRIDGMRLVDTGQRIPLKGGGAALRTADKPR
ncbi:MAG: YncE family protein [Burkholderiales bacterium]|nr:YncE family protein [Burkholderiales bacterium]